MKKMLIAVLFFGAIVCWGEENVEIIQLKQGDKAPYAGVLVPADEYKKMYEAYVLADKYAELEDNLKKQISEATQLTDLKNQQIDLIQKKYDMELSLRKEYQNRYEKNEFKVKALTITTSVGLSISLAEIIGVGVFALMYNSMVK